MEPWDSHGMRIQSQLSLTLNFLFCVLFLNMQWQKAKKEATSPAYIAKNKALFMAHENCILKLIRQRSCLYNVRYIVYNLYLWSANWWKRVYTKIQNFIWCSEIVLWLDDTLSALIWLAESAILLAPAWKNALVQVKMLTSFFADICVWSDITARIDRRLPVNAVCSV